MNDETKMSIAEREAENAGPECAFQRLRLDMDDIHQRPHSRTMQRAGQGRSRSAERTHARMSHRSRFRP